MTVVDVLGSRPLHKHGDEGCFEQCPVHKWDQQATAIIEMVTRASLDSVAEYADTVAEWLRYEATVRTVNWIDKKHNGQYVNILDVFNHINRPRVPEARK